MNLLRGFATALFTIALAASANATGKDIKPPKGFDGKVYKGSLALYASSDVGRLQDRFLCTAQVIAKVEGGYELLSAGHCTPANVQELPPDMSFKVADDLHGPLMPVTLVAARMDEPVDWAIYYLKTDKKYPVVPLGDERLVRINEKTIDVNYSLGLAKEVSMGVVSSKTQTDGPMKGFFEVTQFDSHGASGSSAISKKQKAVIGIVIAGVDGTTTPTWVEPASVIKKEIAGLDVVNGKMPIAVPPAMYFFGAQKPNLWTSVGYNVGLCGHDIFWAMHIDVDQDNLVLTDTVSRLGVVEHHRVVFVLARAANKSDNTNLYINADARLAFYLTFDKGTARGGFMAMVPGSWHYRKLAAVNGMQGAANGLQADAITLYQECQEKNQ